MLNSLFLLLEEVKPKPANEWITYVVMGALIIGVILLMIIPQRKQKKQAQAMMNSLKVGSIVTTIGGIIGKVTEITDGEFVLETGKDETKSVMRFTKQAIYLVHPEGEKVEDKKEEEVYNEIK
ncbi:MAG: preprotein translocase subunit YajC [Clostridia bacterium]